MIEPDEFSSFVLGFDLTSARYSGGAGGTFQNLVPGQEAWTVDGATPSFSTVDGLEGMDFANSSTESILGEMRALYEATIICIAKPGSTSPMLMFGGTYTPGNSFALLTSSNLFQAFHATGASGYTASFTSSQANVFTASYSPFNGTSYAQVNDGTIKSATVANKEQAALNYPDAAIGRGYFAGVKYFTGWVGRVLVFNRALHYRDNTNLQKLILAEMSRVGLA